jgi:His/Glu/Gln/Arg/opine family amino acid ABC transporter permease subunit
VHYHWHFEVVWDNFPYLIGGLLTTVSLTVISMAFGLVLGLGVALIRLKYRRSVPLVTVYVEIFRATPMLVQLLWIYDVLPTTGLLLDAFWSAVIALVLNLGAYLSEIFRAGITSISRGQHDAGLALGMTPTEVFRVIILPQAVRRVIPPLASVWVGLFKDTSLASVIAAAELSYRADVLSVRTYRPIEILTAVGVIYFVITYPQARFVHWLSHALHVRE